MHRCSGTGSLPAQGRQVLCFPQSERFPDCVALHPSYMANRRRALGPDLFHHVDMCRPQAASYFAALLSSYRINSRKPKTGG